MQHIEQRKDVKGYKGYYQVSDMGNVRRVAGPRGNPIKPKTIKLIIKKSFTCSGYCQVSFSMRNVRRDRTVHRLVAEAFLENTFNKPCVNHKNGDRSDNRARNLERCTHKQNSRHSYNVLGNDSIKYLNPRKGKKGALCCNSKAVLQYTLDNIFIREWPSMADIGRSGIACTSGVCNCCNGKVRTSGGYIRRHKK